MPNLSLVLYHISLRRQNSNTQGKGNHRTLTFIVPFLVSEIPAALIFHIRKSLGSLSGRFVWCGITPHRVKIRGFFFSTYPDFILSRICLSQILNQHFHMRIIPKWEYERLSPPFFADWNPNFGGNLCPFLQLQSQTSFLSYALKCIDPTSCFLCGYSPLFLSFSTLFDRKKEREVGKIWRLDGERIKLSSIHERFGDGILLFF